MESETVTSSSDVDTASVTSSNIEGAAAAAAVSPVRTARQNRLLETGSHSGYSVHSSEYAPDWKSNASSADHNVNWKK